MPYHRQPDSLEEQLREEKRLAAALRRRRRKRWLVPLLAVVLAIALLVVLLLLFGRQNRLAEPTAQTEQVSTDATFTLLVAGDVTLSPDILRGIHSGDGYDFHDCFSGLSHTVMLADLAIVNVEGNFCGTPYDVEHAKYPDTLLTALYDCGFDVVQTANSYSIENGMSGLISTKDAVEAAGMIPVGTFRSAQEREECGGVTIVERNGVRVALIAYTKGTNGLHLPEGAEHSVNLLYEDYDTNYAQIDRSGIVELIRNAKARNPDVIVCLVHWGSENTSEVSQSQRDIAELMFDNGVDLIIGTHPHLVGPIEGPSTITAVGTRETGLVAFSLGDLLSASEKESTHAGCMLSVSFVKDGDRTTIHTIEAIPTYSAYPSEEYETTAYRVYDVFDALHLYESSYVERVPASLYEHLKEQIDIVQERTASDYLVKKEYRD